MGPIALHGGGEFLPGDEPFLEALLERAAVADADRARSGAPIRVVIVPTAAAGHAPAAAAALGTAAFERVATLAGRLVDVETAPVIDRLSADDPSIAARLAGAHLVYLPGGDPRLIPSVLPGTAAWGAIREGRSRGAVLAGASAGAMALGPLTWTPSGVVPGLGLVRGIVVFPHADASSWRGRADWFPMAASVGVGILGLGERTGIVSEPSTDDGHAQSWRVIGEAEVRWLPPGAQEPRILRDGDVFELPD